MKIAEAVAVFETAMSHDLSEVQELVLQHVWEGKTYAEIAERAGYSCDYIKSVGSELWRCLSKAVGEPVGKRNVRLVLKRYLAQKPTPAVIPLDDWGDAIATTDVIGRVDELTTLQRWIITDACRFVSLWGMAGVGKTALAIRCAEQVKSEFEGFIWRSLRSDPPFQEFITDLWQSLCPHLDLPSDLTAQLKALLHQLRQHRYLLVIDQWEAVMTGSSASSSISSNGQPDRYQDYGEFLRLVSEERHHSCVVLIGREKPARLSMSDVERLPIRSLRLDGLDATTARTLLERAGITGHADGNDATPRATLNQLIQRYSGNPLALKTVVPIIQDWFGGDADRFLHQNALMVWEIVEMLEQQFTHLSPVEWHLLSCLASYPDGITLEHIQRASHGLASAQQVLTALRDLQGRSLVDIRAGRLKLPALLLEYFRSEAGLRRATTPPPPSNWVDFSQSSPKPEIPFPAVPAAV